ncbi:anaphase-promoting complex subunit 8 [Chytridium lagenaria]|nr:anaphase-promoting complex subunit 8 [Chytridium lagenaria]
MSHPDTQQHLLQAIHECNRRGLYQSAKWAAEILNSLGDSDMDVTEEPPHPLPSAAFTTKETRLYALSFAYFQCKEYARAAYELRDQTHSDLLFLRYYSLYLAGEQSRMAEDLEENPQLLVINKDLSQLYESNQMDAFLLYLYSMVCNNMKRSEDAFKFAIESINLYPYNWSAWLELSSCIEQRQTLLMEHHRMPKTFTKDLFLLYSYVSLAAPEYEVAKILSGMNASFLKSSFVKLQKALMYFYLRDFESSQHIFRELFEDPYTLEHADDYSHVLFVQENRSELCALAHRCNKINKFKPETCAVIGNYYGLIGEGEKAITYFRRGAKLNPKNSTFYTLIGHEYLQLRNTPAAIEAYRKATDRNSRDFKAWFNLGHSYELLRLYYYSHFYFQKAAALQPYDSRVWQALGGCYEKLGRDDDAVRSYKRALETANSKDFSYQETLMALARVFKKSTGEAAVENAYCYYEMAFKNYVHDPEKINDIIEISTFLSRCELEKGNFEKATKYLEHIKEKAEGKALEAEIARARMNV